MKQWRLRNSREKTKRAEGRLALVTRIILRKRLLLRNKIKKSRKDDLPVIITEPVSDDEPETVSEPEACNKKDTSVYRNCTEIAELFTRSFEHWKHYVASSQFETEKSFAFMVKRLNNASLFLSQVLPLLDESIDLEYHLVCYVNPSRLFFKKTKEEIDSVKEKMELAEEYVSKLQIDLHMHSVKAPYYELFESIGIFERFFTNVKSVDLAFANHLKFLAGLGIAIVEGTPFLEKEPKWELCRDIFQ